MSDRTAVVRIKDVQYRVKENDLVKVPLLDDEVGAKVQFDDVLFVGAGEESRVGTPTVEGASVQAEVVEHGRDDKVLVFKMKRRKTYRRIKGHRQHFTNIRITTIQG